MRQSNVLEDLETQEIIQKLREEGFDNLVEILLNGEGVYTKRGRLNKSGACRAGGWKTKELEDMLSAAREQLKKEFDLD